jgi:NADH-quinone oxidoreductase subunit H
VDKPLFIAAPAIMFLMGFIGFAVIPWGGYWEVNGKVLSIQVASLDIGLLYILGVASMGVYGVVMGAWSSNNKYSLYGGIRATAQMLSYEIPMGLCILIVVLTLGTVRLEEMIAPQAGYWFGVIPQWNVFLQPIAFVILFTTMLAEANRAPFDLAEAEQELVGGFHTEYSALKFGMFFLAEYAAMITSSAFLAVLFLGGYHFPGVAWTNPDVTHLGAVLVKVLVLSAKVAASIFVMMWVRWTLPRFRFDQLMRLAWSGLIPLMLLLFAWTVVLVYLGEHRSPPWALGGNAIVLVGALILAGLSKSEITGRTANMPRVEAGRRREVAGLT